MKKIILLGLGAAIAALMASCSSRTASNATDTADTQQAAVATAEASYAISNGEIKPTQGLPLVVDFNAVWCPPCQKLKPIFEEVEKAYAGKVQFLSLDVDEKQNAAVCETYAVTNIPLLLFISADGRVVDKVVGFVDKEELEEYVEALIANK